MADFDPFAAAGIPAPQPAAAAPAATPAAGGGDGSVSQALIPNYDAQGHWTGYTRAPDTSQGAAPTQEQAPTVVAPTATPIDVTAKPAPAPATPAATPAKSGEKFDPFAAAGIPVAAPPATPAPAAAESPHAATLQPVKDAIQSLVQSLTTVPPEGTGPLGTTGTGPASIKGVVAKEAGGESPPGGGTFNGATSSLQHGFTLGLDEILAPLIPAAAESAMTGKSFSKVYDDVVKQMREPRKEFEDQHPYAAAALSTAGAVASPNVFGKLFAGAPAATAAGKTVNAVRNVAAGTGVGAATGFTMADGDVNQRIEGAEQGATAGGVLSAVAPMLGGAAQRVYRFARPMSQVEPTAAKIIRETAGIGPNDQLPVPQASPVPAPSGHPGFTPSSGEAFDNPGLAAEQYRQSQTDPAALAQRRAGWSQAIQEGATTPQAAQGGQRLASALMRPPEASEAAAHAMQAADNVLRTEQSRLWNTPALTNVTPNLRHLGISIDRAISSLSQSVQRDVRGSRLQGFIDDIKSLTPGASLHDINTFRSDILTFARSVRDSDPTLAKAADKIGQIVLDSLETNPALRTNPQAWNDYLRARKFTKDMHDVMDHPVFQKMLQAVKSGENLGGVADGLFNTSKGFESVKGGLRQVQALLDDVRRSWGNLQTANAGTPAVFNFRGQNTTLAPSTAFGARADLGQTARDYLVSKMLDSSVSVGAGIGDVDLQRFNSVHQFLRRNMDMMRQSGLFSNAQMEIADALNRAAIMAQRVANAQAPGSPTYRLFQGEKKTYISSLMGGSISPLWGPLVGSAIASGLIHAFGEVGLGAFLGAEAGGVVAGHFGQAMLANRLEPARQAVIAKIKEAMDNPQIAYDLTRPVGNRLTEETKQWLRSLLAIVPASQAARTLPQSGTVH